MAGSRSAFGPAVVPVLSRAVGVLPSAVQWAGALLVLQLIAYFIVGLAAAGGTAIDEGLDADTLSDLFAMPLRMLLAANGALPGVGWWLNGLTVALVAGRLAAVRTASPIDGSPLDAVLFPTLAGVAYGLLLLVLSHLVEAGRIPVSLLVDLPGDLAELDRSSDWSRTGVVIRGFILATLVGLVVRSPALPMPARARHALRATTRGLIALTLACSLVVWVAGATRFPSRATPVGWLAQMMGYSATVALTAVDLSVFHVVRSVDVLFGGRAPEPIGGAWAVVLLPITVAACAAAFRSSFGPSVTLVDLAWYLGGSAAIGVALVMLGPTSGAWASLVQGAIAVALILMLVGLLVSPWVRRTLLDLGMRTTEGGPGAQAAPTSAPPLEPAATALATTPASCSGCGAPTDTSHRFCGRCGRPNARGASDLP